MINIKTDKNGKIIGGIWDEIPKQNDVPRNPTTLMGRPVVYLDPPKAKRPRKAKSS